jgi:hypothetical protein
MNTESLSGRGDERTKAAQSPLRGRTEKEKAEKKKKSEKREREREEGV